MNLCLRMKCMARSRGSNLRVSNLAVLDDIQDEWEFVADPEVRSFLVQPSYMILKEVQFNPVALALSLLDRTSAGRDPNSFRRAKDMLANSLRGTIDRE